MILSLNAYLLTAGYAQALRGVPFPTELAALCRGWGERKGQMTELTVAAQRGNAHK